MIPVLCDGPMFYGRCGVATLVQLSAGKALIRGMVDIGKIVRRLTVEPLSAGVTAGAPEDHGNMRDLAPTGNAAAQADDGPLNEPSTAGFGELR